MSTPGETALAKIDRANHFVRVAAISLLIIIAAMVGFALYQQSQFIQAQTAAQAERSKDNKDLLEQINKSIKDRGDYQLRFLQCLALTNSATRTKQDVQDCIDGKYDANLILPGDLQSSATPKSQGSSGSVSRLQPAPSNPVDTQTKTSTPPLGSSQPTTGSGATGTGQVDQGDTGTEQVQPAISLCSIQQQILTRCILGL